MIRPVEIDTETDLDRLNRLATVAAAVGAASPRAWQLGDEIATERIELTCGMSELFASGRHRSASGVVVELATVVESCGDFLGRLHALDADSPEDRTHGDFGFSNLFLDPDGRLVVLDPFLPPYARLETWHGDALHRDLGMFASCVIGRVPSLGVLTGSPRQAAQLLRVFLTAYNAHAPTSATASDMMDAARQEMTQYCRHTRRLKATVGRTIWTVRWALIRRHLLRR